MSSPRCRGRARRTTCRSGLSSQRAAEHGGRVRVADPGAKGRRSLLGWHMVGRSLAPLGASLIIGCAAPAPAADATPTASAVVLAPPLVASVASPPPAPTATSSAPADCVGPDRRLRGSTCCTVTRISNERRFPGQEFLRCEGPQIGRPCTSKRDCDVACSCDADDSPRDPRDERHAPKEGTKGLTGFCSGRRQIGVWMCDIDEDGAVTHIIVD